eukprot:1103027-Amphidinium_carterae.1
MSRKRERLEECSTYVSTHRPCEALNLTINIFSRIRYGSALVWDWDLVKNSCVFMDTMAGDMKIAPRDALQNVTGAAPMCVFDDHRKTGWLSDLAVAICQQLKIVIRCR